MPDLNYPQKAILNTLIYSDIFDYPLKPEEVYSYLIGDEPRGQQEIVSPLSDLRQLGLIDEREGLFFLKNREAVCNLRERREKRSEEKLIKAKKWAWLFKLIPWVQLVAVTGAAAAGNTDEDSDIDLMVIADARRIWLTRFLILGLFKILGLRVDLENGLIKDRFCLNLFIADDCLEYPQKNLYTANEIVRIKPIFEREDFYQRFLIANQWVSGFLPNFDDAMRGRLAEFRHDGSLRGVPSRDRNEFSRSLLATLQGETFKKVKSEFNNRVWDFLEGKVGSWQIKKIRQNFPQTKNLKDNEILLYQPNDCQEKIIVEYEKQRQKWSLNVLSKQ